MKNKIFYNLTFGIGGQIIILLIGIIIPWLILNNYGSEVNGLISTVTQIFVYLGLLEAGIGNAALNALYKPISLRDNNGISEVLGTAKKYYYKVSIYYFICTLILSVMFPLIVNSNMDKLTICLIILFQGLTGVVNFYFSLTIQQLLIASGKNYVVSNINLLIYMLTSLVKIILINNGADIILVQFSFFVLGSLKAIPFIVYFKRRFPNIEIRKKTNMMLKERNDFLVHQLSNVVFLSTDMIVLSIFTNLKIVSVYSVYNLVFVGIGSLLNVISMGLKYILGRAYHAKDRERYIKIHDAYECYYMAFVTSLISVAYLLIIPFIKLYTSEVKDINYVNEFLPILFCIIQIFSAGRAVSAELISISGHAGKTKNRSIIETVINVIFSVTLVIFLDIYGVLLGTIIALVYRMNDIIIYANSKILMRSFKRTYINLIANLMLFLFFVIIEHKINLNIESYLEFIIAGFGTLLIVLPVFFVVISLLNFKSLLFLVKLYKKRNHPDS